MRGPRYRFPDEVRATTRAMAARMVREGAIARTPEDLDEWIARDPAARASLEEGGYGTEFNSQDLLPLLQVFVVKAGGPAAPTEAAPRKANPGWGPLLAIAVIVALVALTAALLL